MYFSLGPSNPLLEALKVELVDRAVYGFETDAQGREKLRQLLRVLHGYNKNNTAGDIALIQPGAFMEKLQQGQDLYLASNHFVSTDPSLKQGVSRISAADVKQRQKDVTVYFDSTKITAQEVHKVQQLKAGETVNLQPSVIKDLESKASYVVIRAETKQYCTMDAQATVLAKPIARVSYHSCFPNLESKQSKDYVEFADSQGRLKNDGTPLKEKFKDILRLNRDVAAHHQEGFDVVTPNAFLYGLERDVEQPKAKQLFAQAVFEVAQEDCPVGFLGFFVHEQNDIFQDQVDHYDDIKTPIMVGQGADASAPTRACAALNNGCVVAEAVMAHPLHPAGNGAIGARADQAKEENDDRVMLGDIEWMFSPKLNPKLLNTATYQPMASLNTPVQQTTFTSLYRQSSNVPAPTQAQQAQATLKATWIKMGYPVAGLSIAPDNKVKDKYVMKVDFAQPSQARAFANDVEKLTLSTPPVTIINNTTVILGQDRAIYYFGSSGLSKDGKALFDALALDQKPQQGPQNRVT